MKSFNVWFSEMETYKGMFIDILKHTFAFYLLKKPHNSMWKVGKGVVVKWVIYAGPVGFAVIR